MGFLRSIKNLQKQAKKISVTPGAISVQLDPEELAWINSHPDEWKAMYKKTNDDEMSRVYGPDWREHKAIERLHFSLHDLIEREWHKYKKGDPGARESLIAACQRQITLGPRFARAWREQNKAIGDHRFDDGWLPLHIGFHKLISLMWREENFAEAFRLADLASSQGWGGDYHRKDSKLLMQRRLIKVLKRYKVAKRKAEAQARKRPRTPSRRIRDAAPEEELVGAIIVPSTGPKRQ